LSPSTDLADRFGGKQRGDTLHRAKRHAFASRSKTTSQPRWRGEEENWKVQREPADLRVLAAAAWASSDTAARKMVADWLAATRIEDAALVALAAESAQ
jgi:hypothetical protein